MSEDIPEETEPEFINIHGTEEITKDGVFTKEEELITKLEVKTQENV